MSQFGRARRQGASGCHPHPDAGLPTRRIPYEELRALVVSLIDLGEPELPVDDDDPDAAVREFDSLPTTYHPSRVAPLPMAPSRAPLATPPVHQRRTVPPAPPSRPTVAASPRAKRPTTLDNVLESLDAETRR